MALKQLAQEHLDRLKKKSPKGWDIELYLLREEERALARRKGKPNGVDYSASEGMGLRLLAGGKSAFAAGDGLDVAALHRLHEQACFQLDHFEADPSKSFPVKTKAAAGRKFSDSLWDDGLFKADWKNILPKLREMEAAALKADNRVQSVLRCGYWESRGEAAVANSRGVATYERGSSAQLGLSVLAAQNNETQAGSAMESSRKAAILNFEKAGRDAGLRAAMLLGARKLSTGRRAVVFDPWSAGEFLDLIADLLCADQIQRGKSLLAGRLGERVGSGLATFIDDPRLTGGPASSLYDDEGVPTQRKVLIRKGVVKDFFYDSATAKKDGRRTNASAERGSYKSAPRPGSSNFFLAPGKISRENLLSQTKDGILVYEVMGMHMADPISGEFSVGISGLSIIGGKLGPAVKSAMISGNLLELLERIDLAADDLTFYGGAGAPTFRISDLSVA